MQRIYKETAYFIFITIITLFLIHGVSFASSRDPSLEAMIKIVNDNSLSKDEKLNQLVPFLEKDNRWWPGVFYYIHKVDADVAEKIALAKFRDNTTSREGKLSAGSFLMQRYDPKPFIEEYSKFLINAILEGGVEEFCCVRERRKISAIGQYAFIAADFEGYKNVDFEYFKDKCVIPALIKGLSAPDTIYEASLECFESGKKPGESTRENGQRAFIPIALAKLEATEATEPMKSILFISNDYLFRRSCAYALAYLMNREDSYAIEKYLQEGEGQQFLFGFGKGLLAKDNPDGLKYMRFEFLPSKDKDYCVITYNVELILEAVNNIKSPDTEGFYAYLIYHEGVKNIFLFDKSKIKFPSHTIEFFDATEEELLKRDEDRIAAIFDKIVSGIIANDLKDLFPRIGEIGEKTKSEKIRHIAATVSVALPNANKGASQ